MSVRRQEGKCRSGRKYAYWIVDIVYHNQEGREVRIRKVPRVKTRAAAEKLERQILSELEAGQYGKEKAGQTVPTLEQFAEEFMANYAQANNKPSELASKRQILRNHLLPYFGSKRLDEIGARQIETYKGHKLKTGTAGKTINNHLAVLGKMLRLACEWEVLPNAPRIKPLKLAKPKFDFLDFEEAQRLVDACEGQLRSMVIVFLNTGLRVGELRALRWEDIDFHRGQLLVRRNDWYGIEGTPKSGRERTVPLNEVALAVLKEHRHLRGPQVFYGGHGKLRHNEFVKPLASACRRASLRIVSWHVLRHTFASHLAMRGIPIKVIAELLGQATIAVTERYAHLSPQVSRTAVDALLENLRQYSGNAASSEEKTLTISRS